MTSKDLLSAIKAHLKLTKEGEYAWSLRVMGDKTFLWKLKNLGRKPYKKTASKIMAAIKRREKKLGAANAKS